MTVREMVVRFVADQAYEARKNGRNHSIARRSFSLDTIPNFSAYPMDTFAVVDFAQELATENKGSYIGKALKSVLDTIEARRTFTRFGRDVNARARRVEFQKEEFCR